MWRLRFRFNTGGRSTSRPTEARSCSPQNEREFNGWLALAALAILTLGAALTGAQAARRPAGETAYTREIKTWTTNYQGSKVTVYAGGMVFYGDAAEFTAGEPRTIIIRGEDVLRIPDLTVIHENK